MFPSPCGEKVGINPVPEMIALLGGEILVSVPLRGKGRDQLRALIQHKAMQLFPSPCGEKVGINAT